MEEGIAAGETIGETIGGIQALVGMDAVTTIGEEATDRRLVIEVAEIRGWRTVFSQAGCDHNGRLICR